MKLLVFLLCGFPLLTIADGENSPYVYECTTPGSFCSKDEKECEYIYVCIPVGGNEWSSSRYKCPGNDTCNDGACSEDPSAMCSGQGPSKFQCKSLVGMYPDPFDCTTFHFCIPEKSLPPTPPPKSSEMEEDDFSSLSKAEPETDRCSDGFSYNPATTYCDKPLINNRCSEPPIVPKCERILQDGALSSNSVLYYVCLPEEEKEESPEEEEESPEEEEEEEEEATNNLYPYLYMCPNGKRYQGNFRCV